MMNWFLSLIALILVFIPSLGSSHLYIGTSQVDITPKVGTPSAGYRARQGEEMTSVHDLLLASTILIENENKLIALCGVDNLGFTYDMAQKVISEVHKVSGLEKCELYIGFSHTHSGGGAYLNFPPVGEILAGKYDPAIAQSYIEGVIKSIVSAKQNLQPAKVGFGYAKLPSLIKYRGSWPENVSPPADLAVIKFTKLDDSPLAVFFSYAAHPTILGHENRAFSADFVGYARAHIQSFLGDHVCPVFFNGAQGDINPKPPEEGDEFTKCDAMGNVMAKAVKDVWDNIEASNNLQIETAKDVYEFASVLTPAGFKIAIDTYKTELNLLVFNKKHAFLTIPGELSTVYDAQFKEYAAAQGLQHLTVLGLVNDAHGYIIIPEAWLKGTFESRFSFGGEFYGDFVSNKAKKLLSQIKN